MFGDLGNQLVQQALAEFLWSANESDAQLKLVSFHDRLSGFQDEDVQSGAGAFYDDYFGWADPSNFDESGVAVSRHDD